MEACWFQPLQRVPLLAALPREAFWRRMLAAQEPSVAEEQPWEAL